MVMAQPPRLPTPQTAAPSSASHRTDGGRYRVAHDARSVNLWRAGYLALLCVCLSWRLRLDAELGLAWSSARDTWWLRHDSFEPWLATGAFAFWINCWRVVDLFCPALQRWRINSTSSEVDLKGQGKLEFVLRPGFSNLAIVAYLLPLLVFDQLYPRRQLPLGCPTSAELVGGVCCSIFVYDFIFYWIHLALHKVPWLFRHVHSTHHRQVDLTSKETGEYARIRCHNLVTVVVSERLRRATTVHHSLLDGTLQVGANIVALKLLGLHPLTRAVHNIVVTYLLTETHAGYDMPWMLHNVIPCGVLGGAPRHEAHHHCGSVHYHQFFTYLDRWLGHERADTEYRDEKASKRRDSDVKTKRK